MSKESREKEIKEIFKLNKLEFKNYGDIYSYINYGKPDINTIIQNTLSKLSEKNERRIRLSKELIELNIPYDETYKGCYEYINNIGTKEFIDIIRSIEVEHFLRTQTDYLQLRKKYNDKTAQDIAIRQYSENELLPKNILESKKIKVCFE
ncbi:hypothetical protein Indivirus_2_100 [Indivirus ILV1]|uniref:Uncharacterized protein n=1 Tax=Indivirus ILV1 TaxID=1977633 RepID=A0A1V0SDF4_9VIRU|nr:hypothetical protein Indivirus_2_100 [Indivirus ILV1]